MKSIRLWLAMMAIALTCMACAGGGTRTSSSCDRKCLQSTMDKYLAAVLAHDPSKAPLARQVRFTEDTVEMKPGEGVWKTASALRGYRQDFLDVRAGVAGTHVVVEEAGQPALLVVRLKVVDKKITEIETQVARSAKEATIFEVDALKAATPAMSMAVPAGQLESRDNAIKIAAHYPDGLKAGSFVEVDAPFAADAYRFENGRRMAGKGCTFRPPSCEDIRAQKIPKLSSLTYRLAAVDEEMGIVWFRLDFGPGSVGPKDKSLIVWEAFKVYGGQMHAVEAFMKVMPAGTGSGWN